MPLVRYHLACRDVELPLIRVPKDIRNQNVWKVGLVVFGRDYQRHWLSVSPSVRESTLWLCGTAYWIPIPSQRPIFNWI